jgi:hypothetical protein
MEAASYTTTLILLPVVTASRPSVSFRFAVLTFGVRAAKTIAYRKHIPLFA